MGNGTKNGERNWQLLQPRMAQKLFVVLYPNPHENAKANMPQKPDWAKFKSFKPIQM